MTLRRAAVFALAVALGPAASLAGQDRGSQLERARQILREVPLIDGHNDLPWQLRIGYALDWDSLDIRQAQPQLMTDIPRLRAGMVGAQFWSTYSPVAFTDRLGGRVGMEQGDVVHQMIARYPDVFELALTADDIERIHGEGRVASMLGLEGGHMIQNSLGLLRAFYRDGVRYMTLTHSRNTDWADASTDEPEHGGLTRFGEEVVREMNRLGMLVDISHVHDSTMWDVLRVAQAPVIFSHSSSRHFTPHPRNVPDDVMRAVAENGGVIMVTYVPQFIHLPRYEWDQRRDSLQTVFAERYGEAGGDSLDAWERRHPMPRPDLGVVADHIEHLRNVAGVDHVGIGGDLDGISSTPTGLEDVSTYPNLVAELLHRGWSERDVKKVVGLNVLRVMRRAEGVAVRLAGARPPSAAQIEVLDGWDEAPPWRGPGRP